MFLALTATVLGPSLVGMRVAVPHDLLFHTLPWAADPPAGLSEHPTNPELRDQIDHYYPIQEQIVTGLRSGADVSWLPDVALGYPGWAFVVLGAVSPFQLPGLVLPFDLAWSWGMALRLLVAMGGAYVLARSFGVGRAGATVAGIAYGLCGYMIGWLGWPQTHVGAFIPWVWVATRACVAPDRRWWALPALALATTGLWLGGFPAVTLYALIAAGVVAMHAAWPHRGGGVRPVALGLGTAAGGVLTGTALAAFTLLPSVLLLGQFDVSARENMWQARIPVEGLATFLVPRLFGHVDAGWSWLQAAQVETIGYVGIVTLALAACAWLLTPRRPGTGLATGLALVFGAVAYGVAPFPALIARLPALSTNAPARVLVIVGLALALLGGLGADALVRWVQGRRALARNAALVAGGVAVLAGVGAAVVRPVDHLRGLLMKRLADPAALSDAVGTARGETAVALALLVAAVLVVVAARGLAGRRRRLAAAVMAVGLVAVVGVDLGRFATGWNVQVPREDLFPDAPGVDELVGASTRHRVVTAQGTGLPNTHLQLGFRDLRARALLTARHRDVLDRMDARFPSPTGWDLPVLRSSQWEPWLTLLGVRAVLVEDWVDLLPAPFERAVDETPIGLAGEAIARVSTEIADDRTLTGVQLRVGTFGRRNEGFLQVRAGTGAHATTGRVPLVDLEDNGVVTVPVSPLEVSRGQRVRVEVSATIPPGDEGVAVFGRSREGRPRPSIGLAFEGDRVYDGRDVGPVRVYENTDAPPLVYAVTTVRGVDRGGALDVLERMEPAEVSATAVVEPLGSAPLPELPDADDATVTDWAMDGGTVRAAVDADEGALLVVLQEALGGWEATVDDRAAELVRVNHLFLGVVVPPGGGQVVLRHVPAGLPAGAAISLAATLGLVIVSTRAWRRRPGRADDAPTDDGRGR